MYKSNHFYYDFNLQILGWTIIFSSFFMTNDKQNKEMKSDDDDYDGERWWWQWQCVNVDDDVTINQWKRHQGNREKDRIDCGNWKDNNKSRKETTVFISTTYTKSRLTHIRWSKWVKSSKRKINHYKKNELLSFSKVSILQLHTMIVALFFQLFIKNSRCICCLL